MKNTTKRSSKSLKKIQMLIFLMLITLILAITATYAWFSTQRDVEITGMKLNVEVAESMQISLDGEKWAQSIQIANMRQFYGTYNGTQDAFAIYQAKSVNAEGNTNYVPTEMLPVSTAGEVSSGKLQFVQGTIATNADGSSKLTGITTCSEADLTNTASIADRQNNNKNHPYLVFDMYLRNISAKTTGQDDLLMNIGSRVWIDTTSVSDQEGVGKDGTGLEYSARVGMIVYGNTLDVTTSDVGGAQARALTANGLTAATNPDQLAIWEPNHLNHTQYVVNNNGRGITALSQEVETYGIKVASASATPAEIANINSTTDSNLVNVDTFTPSYTNVVDGTTAKETITSTSGTNVGLAPNKISKVRVYIWLEGQDPDCVDLASTGDKLNVTLKLTKDQTTTTQPNTYEGAAPSGGGAGGPSNGITAAQLYAMTETEKQAIYGATVTNYKPTNGASNDETNGTKWKIFHSDGENIYLIASDYIDRSYAPTGRGTDGQGLNGTTTVGSGSYARGFSLTPYADYDGTADIDSALVSKLLKQYTDAGYTATSQNDNAKATAYLMDTTMWGGFKDNTYAGYAIGGPTIELFRDSYNATHETDIETQVTELGYQLRFKTVDDSNSYANSISGLNTSESLYVISSKTNAYGMWLASPSADGALNVMCVGFSGYVGNLVYSSSYYGARPLVSLKSGVKIEKIEEGKYQLVQ